MELLYRNGCTVGALCVDDTRFYDLSMKDKRELCKALIDKCSEDSILEELFISFLETYGEGGYKYTCEDCGDSVYEYTYSL